MICTLSETGLLQCCYLGTDPVSASIPAIMPSAMLNVQDAEEQLSKLNRQIKQAMNDPSKRSIDILVVLTSSLLNVGLVVKRIANAQVTMQIEDTNQFTVREKQMNLIICLISFFRIDD